MPYNPRWGYINEAGVFVPLPKQPLILGGFKPPCDVTLPSGEVRRVVLEPTPEPEQSPPI